MIKFDRAFLHKSSRLDVDLAIEHKDVRCTSLRQGLSALDPKLAERHDDEEQGEKVVTHINAR